MDFFKTRYDDDIDYTETKIEDIIEVALYQIAAQIVPWKQESEPKNINFLKEELTFLLSNAVVGNTWATYMSFSLTFSQNRSLFNIPSKVDELNVFLDDALCIPRTLIFNLLKNKPANSFETDNYNNIEDIGGNQELNSKLDQACEEIKQIKKELEFNNDMIFEKLEELKTAYRASERIQPRLNKFSQFAKGVLIAFLVLIVIFQMK